MRELAQREAAAHESALQEASQKAARLARLEGTSIAWCYVSQSPRHCAHLQEKVTSSAAFSATSLPQVSRTGLEGMW